MHAFDVLGDPVRRRLLELLSDGERSAGWLGEIATAEYGITQPAVSRHLRVLRESGFVRVRPEGARRMYAVDPAPMSSATEWLRSISRYWNQRLDALDTELRRESPRTSTPKGQP